MNLVKPEPGSLRFNTQFRSGRATPARSSVHTSSHTTSSSARAGNGSTASVHSSAASAGIDSRPSPPQPSADGRPPLGRAKSLER
jgi:hypothetical protein